MTFHTDCILRDHKSPKNCLFTRLGAVECTCVFNPLEYILDTWEVDGKKIYLKISEMKRSIFVQYLLILLWFSIVCIVENIVLYWNSKGLDRCMCYRKFPTYERSNSSMYYEISFDYYYAILRFMKMDLMFIYHSANMRLCNVLDQSSI